MSPRPHFSTEKVSEMRKERDRGEREMSEEHCILIHIYTYVSLSKYSTLIKQLVESDIHVFLQEELCFTW